MNFSDFESFFLLGPIKIINLKPFKKIFIQIPCKSTIFCIVLISRLDLIAIINHHITY